MSLFNRKHGVFAIPELLAIVFAFNDKTSNAASARVCKAWSKAALDCLWYNMSGFRPLFELLGPIVVERSKCISFSRRITPDNWTRFQEYARRIRRFTINSETADHSPFSSDAISRIMRTRLSLHLLPNLLHLTILSEHPADLQLAVVFLHAHLASLVIRLPCLPSAVPFLEEVTARSPKLALLDIRTILEIRCLEPKLCRLLLGLAYLKKIILPRFHISTAVMDALSMLPDLGTIQFEYFSSQGMGNPSDVQPFSPTLQEGAFPSLRDLSFHATLSDAAGFFGSSFAPTNITELYIHSVDLEPAGTFSAFLSILAETCQMLAHLGIDLMVEDTDLIMGDDAPGLAFDDLRPVLDFPNLTKFTLMDHRALRLTDGDLVELASKWRSLEHLDLNSSPVTLEVPQVTLAALLPFAQHCPNLDTLALHVDTSAKVKLPEPAVPFAKLASLDFGTSPVDDVDTVVLYLSLLCPLRCDVATCDRWPTALSETLHERGLMEGYSQRWEVWAKVQGVLPLFTRLRSEERMRTKDLEALVADLETRVKILEEQRVMLQEPGVPL